MNRHRAYLTPSARYKGPRGDSRPETEIFADMELRAKHNQAICDSLEKALTDALRAAPIHSLEGRLDMIRECVVDWLVDNDPRVDVGRSGEEDRL